MIQTILSIKYKTRNYKNIKIDNLICSPNIFKNYTGYNQVSDKMKERFSYCDLVAAGNEHCRLFLNDIIESCVLHSELNIEYEEKCKESLDKILKCEILEVKFGMKNYEEFYDL
jgi:hypothetical protein